MNNKRYRLIKKSLSLALAGIMTISFAGCKKREIESKYTSQESYSLVDDNGNDLCVIGFEQDDLTDENEKYGYFDLNTGKFYDLIKETWVDLNEMNKSCNIHYIKLIDILSSELKYECLSDKEISAYNLNMFDYYNRMFKNYRMDCCTLVICKTFCNAKYSNNGDVFTLYVDENTNDKSKVLEKNK